MFKRTGKLAWSKMQGSYEFVSLGYGQPDVDAGGRASSLINNYPYFRIRTYIHSA
jgi:hypothetical protein